MQAPKVSASRVVSDRRRIRATSRSTTLSEATAASTLLLIQLQRPRSASNCSSFCSCNAVRNCCRKNGLPSVLRSRDLRQRTNRGGVQAQGVTEQRDDVVELERREGELVDGHAGLAQLVEREQQRLDGRLVVVAVGADHEHV